MIYADHNATTPPLPEVIERVREVMAETWGNASSVHGPGQRARAAVERAREAVAQAIGVADAREIVFTSGGTESVAAALVGAITEPEGAHLVTTAVEHPAVHRAVEQLARAGCTSTIVGVDRQGRLDPAEVVRAIGPCTRLVSVQWVNHETGNVHPIRELGAACRERGVLFHVDAVQALGKVDVEAGIADLLSLSAHKVHGPKGTGALHVGRGVALRPLLAGGQERGRRGGTEDVAAIAGFGEAARILVLEGALRRARVIARGERLERGLVALGGLVNGAPDGRAPGTVNVSFPGVPAELLVVALDLGGVAIAAGAACTSGLPGASPVIRALFPDDPARVASAVRYSIGKDNTDDEIDTILHVTCEAIERLRASLEPAPRSPR